MRTHIEAKGPLANHHNEQKASINEIRSKFVRPHSTGRIREIERAFAHSTVAFSRRKLAKKLREDRKNRGKNRKNK